MKYFPRAELYKASNVTFDPKRIEARSYDWWYFVKKFNGKIYFNNFRYSTSTAKHQRKVESLMDALGIKVDSFIECRKGFQNIDWLESTIGDYDFKIMQLKLAMRKPRTHKSKNLERQNQIAYLERKIKELTKLKGKL